MVSEIFGGSPVTRLQARLRLGTSAHGRVLPSALGIVALTWLPLALLAAVGGRLLPGSGAGSFLGDFAVHARCLIAIPLLILADQVCVPRLSAIVRQFEASDLIRDSDRPGFQAALSSTRALHDSTAVEFVLIGIAYSIVAALACSGSPRFPAWHMAGAGLRQYSPAGYWHLLVSLPLLLMLLLGWTWRLLLWSRLLWSISRLNLHLLPAHPDHAAGLMFAGHSLRAWAVLATTPSVIACGTLANRIVHEGITPASCAFPVGGIFVFTVVVFIAPLLVFARNLLPAWRHGVLKYGALAERVGHEFELQWTERAQGFPENPMETGAFSATTDLFQIVSNVYQMRLLPIDIQSVAFLAAATLLPFLPLVLISEPLGVILKQLASLLV